MCSPASTIISVMPNGNVTSIVKIGYGSMQDTTLLKMLEVFEKISINIKMSTILLLMIYYSQIIYKKCQIFHGNFMIIYR